MAIYLITSDKTVKKYKFADSAALRFYRFNEYLVPRKGELSGII